MTTTTTTSGDKAFRRPTGAPTKIDDIVAHVNGEPITVAERIVSALSAGAYIETAAASADVDKVTLYDWLKKGAKANTKRASGKALGANEKRYAEFANEVARAEAEAELIDLGELARVARGGHKRVTTTTKVDQAGRVETVTREEVAEPNVAALTWRLERRWVPRWGRRQLLEITGADGGPVKVDSPLTGLMGDLDAMERRQQAAVAAMTAAQVATAEDVDVVEDVPTDG